MLVIVQGTIKVHLIRQNLNLHFVVSQYLLIAHFTFTHFYRSIWRHVAAATGFVGRFDYV